MDVYTTDRGMKWDCVYEANPLLPSVPHLDRLLIHKALFLHPFHDLDRRGIITNEDMAFPLLFTAFVVHNNLRVIDKAKRKCQKRS